MIETMYVGESICGLVIRNKYQKQGIEFFTTQSDTLQLGYMSRPKNYKILPHIHKKVLRTVEYTNEVLFIKSGRVRVNFYDDNKKFVTSTDLEMGDVILLTMHGHGFEMLEDAEIIEVKQGPYVGENDKIRFEI